MNDKTYSKIPVKEQNQTQLYDMQIRFKGDAIPTELNNIAQSAGLHEGLILQNAIILRINQVVSFIPDDEALQKYARVLEEAQAKNQSSITVKNLKFDGYDYIYAVTPD